MAEQLENYNFSQNWGRRLYDWDTWLNGSIWRLTKGQDYHCATASLYDNARRSARARGLGFTANMTKDSIILQAFKEGK